MNYNSFYRKKPPAKRTEEEKKNLKRLQLFTALVVLAGAIAGVIIIVLINLLS